MLATGSRTLMRLPHIPTRVIGLTTCRWVRGFCTGHHHRLQLALLFQSLVEFRVHLLVPEELYGPRYHHSARQYINNEWHNPATVSVH